jgi:uncharacterized protein
VRVFLDTNVLVSAVATRGLCSDILQAVLAEHQLVLGETVLGELQRVLRKKLGVPAHTAHEMDEFLRHEAAVMSGAPALGFHVRDPDDIAVLEEAAAGEVEVLVTGDRDLLDVASRAPVRIVNPRGFWDQLRAEAEPEE